MRREALLVASPGDGKSSWSDVSSPVQDALYGGIFLSRRLHGSAAAHAEKADEGAREAFLRAKSSLPPSAVPFAIKMEHIGAAPAPGWKSQNTAGMVAGDASERKSKVNAGQRWHRHRLLLAGRGMAQHPSPPVEGRRRQLSSSALVAATVWRRHQSLLAAATATACWQMQLIVDLARILQQLTSLHGWDSIQYISVSKLVGCRH